MHDDIDKDVVEEEELATTGMPVIGGETDTDDTEDPVEGDLEDEDTEEEDEDEEEDEEEVE